MKKESKTIERNLYIEVKNNAEGEKIIGELVKLLTELRHNKAYINGWIGPIDK